MPMILTPRLVVSAGMPAAGKTTNCVGIAKAVDNSLYLDRDTIISAGFLFVNPAKGEGLLPFHQYIGNELFSEVETPFGPMLQMGWDMGYYYRHAEWSSRMAISHQAAQALQLGKMPIFDCFLAQDVNNGTLKKFMNWEIFRGYPIYLLYFVVDVEVCKLRMISRGGTDEEARRRTEVLLSMFEKELWKHTLTSEGEGFVRRVGCIIDTTSRSKEYCLCECIDYVSSQSDFRGTAA